ncbi:DUF6817 domain-containing protein [Novosphingopyxis sp.]|uniref:DUF6817 domain-containing protein n=1 Tax=Novosphingopyxis sp. TaxID=2709690 RepID=UPI003B5AB532
MAVAQLKLSEESRNATERGRDLLLSYPGINVRHSNTTLVSHLEGVAEKLRSWGCREALCSAGLFHSVYGTENFRRQTVPISARPKIAAVIGHEAENLAYKFCTLETRNFVCSIEQRLGQMSQTESQALDNASLDMLHLFAANWLEQYPRMRAIQRNNFHRFFATIAEHLVPLAGEEIERIYKFKNHAQPKHEQVQLLSCDNENRELHVLDDLIPIRLQHSLSALMERNIWRYGWKSADTQNKHFFWHSHFAGDNDDGGEVDCESELQNRPLVAPVLQLWQLVRENVGQGHYPVRIYANGHTYGCDGHVHTDSERSSHYTALYYASPEWDENWGGETAFFDPSRKEIIKSVFPRPGRLVFFDGRIPHVARSPSRDCAALRSVIVFKSFCPLPPAS